MNTPLISFDNVTYCFGRHKVLDDVSLSVPRGGIYGFLGPNGAGKTTALRLMTGLLTPQTGHIRVFGGEPRWWRADIGALIEQPSLYHHLSGPENLDIYRLSYGCNPGRTAEVLDMVGLDKGLRIKVRHYSLGMKQRLAIAIALMNDPELLILDEPVNGLDPLGIIDIRMLLVRLNRDQGKTILISSHFLSEIEKTATDIGIIARGRLRYQGPPPENLETRFVQLIQQP
jgi:ABC-2 type transport system ATP-binding protein